MKQSVFNNIKLIAIALVIAVGINYAFADSVWFGPTDTPPGDNVSAPINAGAIDQVKVEGLSVNGFIAKQDAKFKDEVFVADSIQGGSPVDTDTISTVYVGDATKPVRITANGKLGADGYIRSTPLANNERKEICADSSGTLVICP